MKQKIFLTVLSILFALCINAQEVDSMQVNPSITRIDSLTTQLNKLQHDFNYLKCESLINQISNEILREDNSVLSRSNGILINCYHNKFNSELYNSYIRQYDSEVEWLDAMKEKTESVQRLVAMLCLISNFTETELDVLLSGCKNLNLCFDKFEKTLDYYKLTTSIYLDLK